MVCKVSSNLRRSVENRLSTTASGGLTALHLAVKSDVNGNNLPVIDVLLSCSALNVNAVHEHILIDSLPIIPSGAQAIYLAGDDRKQAFVSSRSLDGKYHIILTEGQHVDNVAREQLQVLSDPGTKRSHHSTTTIMYDDFAMVEALLTSPGDHVLPNVRRSGDGFTPLHLACEMENMKIIKLLLDHGASLTQLSSMSAHGVSPLQLLMKFDTLENDKLKELISENYLRPEMLLDGATMYVTARPNSAVSDSSQQDATVKSGSEIQANDGDDGDATSCALLREEQHNFDLFEPDMQEKVKLQQQERKHLTTQLAMEKSLERDLSKQLQQLEGELTQLHLRHAYNRAEIEGERRAVQSLEQDYASLIDQELELKRDCEVLELQLGTQQAQLREIRSQQLYLDFVSSAPLKRHMEEKKWQEQHAAVALQVQNAEVENRQLEDEIRKLEEETSNLEAQYARDVQTKQQLEASLRDIQANYEQFKMRLSEPEHATHRGLTGIVSWMRHPNCLQKYQWGMAESSSTGDEAKSMINDTDKDKAGVLERLDSTYNIANKDDDQHADSGRTKTLVKEMLHWIERLQKHCGVNLHLSRVQCNLSIGPFGWSLTRPLFCDQIWHDVEEARVELNILHHQLDRAVRKTSMLPNILPNDAGVITIAATSPTSGPLRREDQSTLWLSVRMKLFVREAASQVGFQPMIAEWGYNLLLALQLFSWDSEIEMFLLCLTGAVSDLVYVDQEQMIQGCQQLLLRLCELYNVESFVAERRVLLKDALVALRTYFPLKTSAQLQAIEQAIIRDMHKMKRGGNDSILYIDDILPWM
ncbi:Ankyrin repeat-containing domain [Phytophthora cactorum]|nr:Ankyrin repeat-containing domain [Phytophthora cactorum]